jgi:hypothetical protein
MTEITADKKADTKTKKERLRNLQTFTQPAH